MDACVEGVEVVLAEGGHVGEMISGELHLTGKRLEVGAVGTAQRAADKGMAEAWQVGIVGEMVHVEPP